MEALEERELLSLVPITTRRDLVYDATRDMLYITTSSGVLERYDLASQTLQTPYSVGTSLNGADTTPDNQFMYVAEDVASASQGVFHKINLATGTATDITYNLTFGEDGAWDVAIGCDGKGLVSTQFSGSGWVPLREIDLGTDTLTIRTDALGSGFGGEVRQDTLIQRNGDRSFIFLAEDNISNGPFFTYDPLTDRFLASGTTGAFLFESPSVNRNGTLVALGRFSGNILVYDRNLNLLRTLTGLDGGFTFDPIRDILYTVDSSAEQIVAYNTNTWVQMFTIPVGENVSRAFAFGDGTMLVSSDGAWLFLSTPMGVRTYNLNSPGVVFAQSAGCTDIAEGGTTDAYSVKLAQAPTANVVVSISPNAQVTTSRTTMTFTPANWNNPQTVTVTAVNDTAVEGYHHGLIAHGATSADANYNGIGINVINPDITDNDTPGVVIAASGGTTDVAEGGATDAYSVVLNGAPTASVSVNVTPDSQLTTSASSLIFTTLNWNTPQIVTVTAVNDAAIEGIHSGVVTHTTTSADANFNALPIAPLTAAITDNDFPPGVTVTQSGGSTSVAEGGPGDAYTVFVNTAPTANVVVNLSAGSSQITLSAASLTFTPANFNTPQTVTVTAVNDAIVEGTQTAVVTQTVFSTDPVYNGLSVASVTATILDNDGGGVTLVESGGATDVAEGGATDTYSLVLNQVPIANVVISVQPGSQASANPAVLTFTPANWNAARTVIVTAVDDMVYEGPHIGILTHAISTTDPAYASLTVPSVFANITDNDPPSGVLLSKTAVNVTEGGATGSYTLKLASQPSGVVTITLLPDAELSVAPSTLVFTASNWNTPRVVTVTAVNDVLFEGPRSGLVGHFATSGDPMYDGIAITDVTANITDNDLPPDVVFSVDSVALLEGTSKNYTLVLSAPPTADVVIAPSADSQLVVPESQTVFTKYNWNVPHQLTVAAVDDAVEEGVHFGLVSYVATSADPNYDGLAIADLVVNLLDNDGSLVAGTAGNDTITVDFSATVGQIYITINGKTNQMPTTLSQLMIRPGTGINSITITNPTVPISIVGDGTKDNIVISGQTIGNNFTLDGYALTVNGAPVSMWGAENLVVMGSKAVDKFTLTGVPSFPVELKGDAGMDHVTAPDLINTWSFTGTNNGLLDKTVKLTAIEYWNGGTNADTYAFSAGRALTGRINGGGGYDVLDYTSLSTQVLVNMQTTAATLTGGFSNIAKVRGGKGTTDKLTGPNQSNLWTVTGTNLGDVNGTLAFEGVENLTGGAQDDTFNLANNVGIKGKIDGGDGDDVLSYASYLSAGVTINLQSLAATNTGGWLNLEQFVGGAGTSDLFIGANKGNAWKLTDINTGNVNGTIQFAGFDNLQGGTLTDSFQLEQPGNWTGTLSGAGGKDTLAAWPGAVNAWQVSTGSTAGTLNGKKFTNIEVRQ